MDAPTSRSTDRSPVNVIGEWQRRGLLRDLSWDFSVTGARQRLTVQCIITARRATDDHLFHAMGEARSTAAAEKAAAHNLLRMLTDPASNLPLSPQSPATGSQPRLRTQHAATHRISEHPPLPLAQPLIPPPAPTWMYTTSRLDSGRVENRSVLRSLGWIPGDLLTQRSYPNAIVVRHDPDGVNPAPLKSLLHLPAPLRRRCGLADDDSVLLAANPHLNTLIVYPMALLDRTMTPEHEAFAENWRR
ncbi:hypothetical protein [Amycolatopsis samaneae]|uniref:DRBM domain-containing protein n=1 Tax=Amycolatopsis samaneae TaxID=664691 RepID=A0ABW5GX82_9PSEU